MRACPLGPGHPREETLPSEVAEVDLILDHKPPSPEPRAETDKPTDNVRRTGAREPRRTRLQSQGNEGDGEG